jgi:asparagine synthase (glutamine-hydrolysing)
MCGIAALAAPLNNDEARTAIELMLRAQSHRGPDDSGVSITSTPAGAIALGSRRLAIQDVSQAGHQPMIDAVTGAVIVYNGEIYNFVELRSELTNRGHRFHGASDTEVLLCAYREWGRACLDRLRGMFAFVIWEPQKQLLFAARDHLGIKPLYMATATNGALLFGSEIRVIVASGLLQTRVDRRGLAGYLAYGATQEPLTIFENVRMLPPASWVVANAYGKITEAGTFWHPPLPADNDKADADLVAEGRGLLERAVGRHMRSDVPVGVYLSSGLDSTAILGLARRAVSGPVHAFTVAFTDLPALDESPIARQTAERLGAEYHHCPVDMRNAASWAEDAMASMDQPVMDGVNTYIVSRAVREKGLIVALSGQGGDELFGGYPSFTEVPAWHRALRPVRLVPVGARRMMAAVASVSMTGVRADKIRDLAGSEINLTDIYFQRRRLLSDSELSAAGFEPAELGLTSSFHDHDSTSFVVPNDAIASVRNLEIGYYLRNILLRDADVFGMASSLEIRVPFLDRDVVDWALRIPGPRLLLHGEPKYWLRRMCADLYDREQLSIKKRGFTPPFAGWLLGPMRARMEDALNTVKASGIIKAGSVDAVRKRFLAEPQTAAWSRVWSLTTLGTWLEQQSADAARVSAA